jgi:hypothetical protein
MAQVRLTREEATEGIMPRVCMRCGADATITKAKTFSWHPQWADTLIIIGLLCFTPLLIIGIICSIATTVRMRVIVPLCDEHKNHWSWRAWFIYGGLAFFALVGIGCLAFLLSQEGPDQSDLIGFVCVAPAVLGFIWLIAAAIVQSGAIKPAEITDRGITLNKVSPDFVQAMEKDRRADYDDEYRNRPRRDSRDDDRYYEPDGRQPKRPPSDAYRENEH